MQSRLSEQNAITNSTQPSVRPSSSASSQPRILTEQPRLVQNQIVSEPSSLGDSLFTFNDGLGFGNTRGVVGKMRGSIQSIQSISEDMSLKQLFLLLESPLSNLELLARDVDSNLREFTEKTEAIKNGLEECSIRLSAVHGQNNDTVQLLKEEISEKFRRLTNDQLNLLKTQKELHQIIEEKIKNLEAGINANTLKAEDVTHDITENIKHLIDETITPMLEKLAEKARRGSESSSSTLAELQTLVDGTNIPPSDNIQSYTGNDNDSPSTETIIPLVEEEEADLRNTFISNENIENESINFSQRAVGPLAARALSSSLTSQQPSLPNSDLEALGHPIPPELGIPIEGSTTIPLSEAILEGQNNGNDGNMPLQATGAVMESGPRGVAYDNLPVSEFQNLQPIDESFEIKNKLVLGAGGFTSFFFARHELKVSCGLEVGLRQGSIFVGPQVLVSFLPAANRFSVPYTDGVVVGIENKLKVLSVEGTYERTLTRIPANQGFHRLALNFESFFEKVDLKVGLVRLYNNGQTFPYSGVGKRFVDQVFTPFPLVRFSASSVKEGFFIISPNLAPLEKSYFQKQNYPEIFVSDKVLKELTCIREEVLQSKKDQNLNFSKTTDLLKNIEIVQKKQLNFLDKISEFYNTLRQDLLAFQEDSYQRIRELVNDNKKHEHCCEKVLTKLNNEEKLLKKSTDESKKNILEEEGSFSFGVSNNSIFSVETFLVVAVGTGFGIVGGVVYTTLVVYSNSLSDQKIESKFLYETQKIIVTGGCILLRGFYVYSIFLIFSNILYNGFVGKPIFNKFGFLRLPYMSQVIKNAATFLETMPRFRQFCFFLVVIGFPGYSFYKIATKRIFVIVSKESAFHFSIFYASIVVTSAVTTAFLKQPDNETRVRPFIENTRVTIYQSFIAPFSFVKSIGLLLKQKFFQKKDTKNKNVTSQIDDVGVIIDITEPQSKDPEA